MDARAEDEHERFLLKKYAGGRIPPLTDPEDPQNGLIQEKFLQVYHSGFMKMNSLPLGILIAGPGNTPEQKWLHGNYALNQWCKDNWSSFCGCLRKNGTADAACEACDRRRAIMAEIKGEVIAYLCDNGLIDFAVPIFVHDRIMAVLFCGQYRPKPGPQWNREMLSLNGYFKPLAPGEEGIDLAEESQKRIRKASLIMAVAEEDLPIAGVPEISPEGIEQVKELLNGASRQLSELATFTFISERTKVIDWIRNQITSSLSLLKVNSSDTSEVLKKISTGLANAVAFLELDYALVLSLKENSENNIRVMCQYGLKDEDFGMGLKLPVETSSRPAMRKFARQMKESAAITLQDYEHLPFFTRLARLHAHGRSKQALAVPIVTPLGSSVSIVLLGRLKRDTSLDSFSPDMQKALDEITEGLKLVVEVILMVEQMEENVRKQNRFMEEVAHDIRTPIQNLIVESEVLLRKKTAEEAQQVGKSMAAQARRLGRMSSRIWEVVNIDRGLYSTSQLEVVNIYTTLNEIRKSLIDVAEKRNIQVTIKRELESWFNIKTHKALFTQALLNLMDNAIKYSVKNSEVRVDGKYAQDEFSLSFINRGIPLRDEDKEHIFDRYYRTKDAQAFAGGGTGIGLFIVKAFVDEVEGRVEVKSVPIEGTRDSVTEFRIIIPQRRF